MLSILIKDYLLDLKMKGSSLHTVENYGFHLDKFAHFLEQNEYTYSDLTAKQAKLFRNYLVDQGFQSRTVNSILAAVKSFYDFLMEEEAIEGNPIVSSRLRVKEADILPEFMTMEELQEFNNWLNTRPPFHVALGFRLMLATGLRVSEAAALTPQDVVALGNGGYILRVQHGKGDKERYAPVLDAQVARELVRFIEGCPERLPIFRISDRTFKWWAQICRIETGIPFHSHRCRHTVGTQLLQKGIPIGGLRTYRYLYNP